MTEKVWFKIGETAAQVGATPKELRYWERVIPELKPRRSKGNLRYYHLEDLHRLRNIRQWLSEGHSVRDCRELLLGHPVASPLAAGQPPHHPATLSLALAALRRLVSRLSSEPGGPPLELPLPKRTRTPRPRPKTESPSPELAPKASVETQRELGPLGRMWSAERLPLDFDD